MLKIEKAEVCGFEAAIRGMRNPMNSWGGSDSGYCDTHGPDHCIECGYKDMCDYSSRDIITKYIIGPNDHELMMKLRKAGTDHRKFMRMITVYCDITAPLYWWKEFDTYKVGTVADSCSTMHKIAAKEFTLDDFSHEHLTSSASVHTYLGELDTVSVLEQIIAALNMYRTLYLKTKAKDYWWQMIQLLPSSYNQKRTVMMNYEVLANIYKSRKGHKLDEWNDMCRWIECLPYSEIITGKEPD